MTEKNEGILIVHENKAEQTVEQISDELDKQIDCYSKYTKTNPMLGIMWNKKTQMWIINNKDLNLNTKRKKIDDATKLVVANMCNKNKFLIVDFSAIGHIVYKNKKIVLYISLQEPIFDINHIIALLDLVNNNQKYNEFKSKITHYCFKKNEFGGYIIKEFVSEQTMYNIILSSNSEFSKEFKENVSKLLVDLRQQGVIAVINDEIKINPINKLAAITKHVPFYSANRISKYWNKNCIYFAYAGIYNDEEAYKMGKTKRPFARDYFEHRNKFNEFIVLYIIETDNMDEVESLLKQELKMKNLMIDLTIKGEKQLEVFRTTEIFNIEYIINLIDEIVEDHPLPALADKIYEREREKTDHEYRMEQEKTKQLQEKEKTRQLELQLELKKIEFGLPLKIEESSNQQHFEPQIKIEPKTDIVNVPCVEELNIYKQFLDDRTESVGVNIHTRELYAEFINWYGKKLPTSKIPELDDFRKSVWPYIKIVEITANGKTSSGFRNLSIQPNLQHFQEFAKKIKPNLKKYIKCKEFINDFIEWYKQKYKNENYSSKTFIQKHFENNVFKKQKSMFRINDVQIYGWNGFELV